MIKAASIVSLNPNSGEPDDLVGVEATGFEPSTAISVGFGPEVNVVGENPTITDTGEGSYPREMSGYTAYSPIKPGSFSWIIDYGLEIEYFDNGDGTLNSTVVGTFSGTINYTSGYFYRTSTTGTDFVIQEHEISYTTYEFDVTPTNLASSASGNVSANMTIPAIWNGTHPVTLIDSIGNLATSDFEVYGSDIVPEPLTVGAIVLLSSAALATSFYFLRKRSYDKLET